MLNRTAYTIPPSAIKKAADDESEEELDPLMQHRLKQIDEKYSRKNRWVVKVEKEEDRTR